MIMKKIHYRMKIFIQTKRDINQMEILERVLQYRDQLKELSITGILINPSKDDFKINSIKFKPKVSAIKTITIQWKKNESSNYEKHYVKEEWIENTFKQILKLLKLADIFISLERIIISIDNLIPICREYFKDEEITTVEIIQNT